MLRLRLVRSEPVWYPRVGDIWNTRREPSQPHVAQYHRMHGKHDFWCPHGYSDRFCRPFRTRAG